MLQLPYVKLPREFITLLKTEISGNQAQKQIMEAIGPNKGLYRILDIAFKEFDDGRQVDKLMLGLKWPNFRDRMASIYVYRSVYGDYPRKTSTELVSSITQFENQFAQFGTHALSRIFLLGFYMKMSKMDSPIPDSLLRIMSTSQTRSDRIDWLILTTWHLLDFLGEKMLLNYIGAGKSFDEIYKLLSDEARFSMHENLLKYGASIRENDIFLYEKI